MQNTFLLLSKRYYTKMLRPNIYLSIYNNTNPVQKEKKICGDTEFQAV